MTLPPKMESRLTPAEVEMVLRRAAELSARRRGSDDAGAGSISPEVLVQVAAALGIVEQDVRRALFDLVSERTAEPYTLSRRLYGPSRLRAIREIPHPPEEAREHLEDLLRHEHGLKLRQKTEASSLFDAGDLLGAVRRALDFTGNRALMKARSLELRVEDAGREGREGSGASLTADVANQRAEYLSFSGLLGATLALPLAIAGFVEWPYFLAVPPALVGPYYGFRLAYRKTCADLRRSMDGLLDAAEEGAPQKKEPEEEKPRERPPGQIRQLRPIPKFSFRPPKK